MLKYNQAIAQLMTQKNNTSDNTATAAATVSSSSSSSNEIKSSLSSSTAYALTVRLFDALRLLEEQQLKADLAHRRSERLLKECKETKSQVLKLEQELKQVRSNPALLAQSPSANTGDSELSNATTTNTAYRDWETKKD